MQNAVEQKIYDIARGRSLRYKLIAIMLVVSLVVVPAVFWWLKLTGITMAGDAFCGITEHVHSEECVQQNIICGYDEISSDELVSEQSSGENISTTQADIYEEEESTEQNTVETKNSDVIIEDESSTVFEEITEYDILVSEEESSTCEATQTQAYAITTAAQVHVHTDDCYETVYLCEMQEHIHIESCYSDSDADLETAKEWEATLADVVLGDDLHANLVAVAQSQLGYTESTLNFTLDENGERRGYTRYGEWYGAPYAKWSAMFVSFCLHYSGISSKEAPYNSGAHTMLEMWKTNGLYIEASSYLPVSGDVVFIDSDLNGNCDTLGIVSNISDDLMSVIYGGDTSVKSADFALDDETVLGYGKVLSIVENSLSERDKSRIENVKSVIDALPEEDDVLAEMEGFDQTSPEFEKWYYELSLSVMTAYVYYEDLGSSLQLFIDDTSKLDNLAWTWQSRSLDDYTTVASINVYQTNKYSNALTTISYGGSVYDVMTGYLDYKYWDAIVVDKNDSGFYVSSINTAVESKLDMAPLTEEGFILLVWHGDSDRALIADVEVGHSVLISPVDFYKTTAASTYALGTITFTTTPTDNETDNADKLTVIPGADTRDLIEVNLYDYGTNINELYTSSGHIYPGFQQDGGTKSIGSSIAQYSMNFGNNITADIDNIVNNVTTNSPGPINVINSINSSLTGVMSASLVDGYPALATGQSLSYLFSENTYATKLNSQSINGLFQRDSETGVYYFNSRDNHAQYNSSDDTFTLYKQIITSNFMMYPFGNFLPLNNIVTQASQTTTIDGNWFKDIASSALYKYNNGRGSYYSTLNTVLTQFVSLMNSEYGSGGWDYRTAIDKYFSLSGINFDRDDEYLSNVYSIDFDEPTNFFFGMDMHMEFIQPMGGLTGTDGKQEMVFEFTGDDDVWVYVDGVLFLDLSGIHRHVGGKIDFVRGTVEYYDLSPATGNIETSPVKTLTFAEILGSTQGLNENGTFSDYSTHTMDFYYMERGAGSGVCRMNFNMPLIHKNNISVSKQLTTELDIEEMLGNPDFNFQVLKENGTDLFIGSGVSFTLYDESGNEIGTGTTNENGVFTLKAGQTAVFGNIFDDGDDTYFVRELLDESVFEQFGTITVDGMVVTDDELADVQLNGDNFKGIDSPVKNVEEGSTSFAFDNKLDANKLGAIQIEKVLLEDITTIFSFYVTLDGEPLPVGTGYTVLDRTGLARLGVVEVEGMVYIASGETALISKIIAGTEFTIEEIGADELGYTVFYRGEDITVVDGVAEGTVKASTPVEILVVNTEKGSYVEIPYEKTLINPDPTGHRYYFSLTEVTNSSGAVAVDGGITMESTVFVKDNRSGNFMIPFALADMKSDSDVYYFKIEETISESDTTTIYDKTFYVYEVTVTRNETNDVFTQIKGIWKNGLEVIDSATASFTNENVRSLSVSKKVEGEAVETDQIFRFTLLLSHNDEYLNGIYTVTTGEIISDITFSDGIAEIYLKDGETAVISDLPYGTEWTLSETNVDGYFPSYKIDGAASEKGSTSQGQLIYDTEVVYINSTGYVLPETGDTASLIYALGGAMVILAPLVYGYKLRRKSERRAGR